MGKFGKKTVVSSDMSNYMIGIMAPSGFGKTTLMYKVCEKLFGDEGYIILDTGSENGVKAISGVVAEHTPNFSKLNDVVTDIVKNKDTEYPNLKVVVLDTLDAYFEVTEDYVIKDWNTTHASEPNFKKAKSINSVEGGYGKGMERVVDVAKKVISRLNSVGVGVWWTAHIKEKEQTDLFTGTTFTTLTANMNMKYFNSIKNSSHIVACGYYDRAIEKIEVGDENPVTKKRKERNAIIDETRKIKFRDDLLVADAKSRFAHIVDEIPLDKDAFIKAVEDAISAEQAGQAEPTPITRKIEAPKVAPAPDPDEVNPISKPMPIDDEDELEIEDNNVPWDELDGPVEYTQEEKDGFVERIRAEFKGLSREAKQQIKDIRGTKVLEELSSGDLKKIMDIIAEDTKIED